MMVTMPVGRDVDERFDSEGSSAATSAAATSAGATSAAASRRRGLRGLSEGRRVEIQTEHYAAADSGDLQK